MQRFGGGDEVNERKGVEERGTTLGAHVGHFHLLFA